MSNVTITIFNALDQLDAFELPPAAVSFTYLYIVGHCIYLLMASVALWRIKNRFRLVRCTSGPYGTAIIPNSTDALLACSFLFILIDLPYCAFTLVWQRDSAASKHWQIFFGCRYIPAIILFWLLLAATMSIWPFEARKMRYPMVWNFCLIAVPAALVGSFMWAVHRADMLYSPAWDLHQHLKESLPSEALTAEQIKVFMKIVKLYRIAARASLLYVWIGVFWTSAFVLGLFIVGSHTVLRLAKQYFKTRDKVRSQQVVENNSAAIQLQRASRAFSSHRPDSANMASARLLQDLSLSTDDQGGSVLDGSLYNQDNIQTPGSDISSGPPQSVSFSPVVNSGTAEQRQHVAVLRQLRSLLVHTTVQILCIFGLCSGILVLFAAIAARLQAVLASSMRTKNSSIMSAVFSPQIIEQVVFLVLGNFYMASVLHRIRKGSRTVIFPREQDQGQQGCFQDSFGSFLKSGTGSDAQQQHQQAPVPVFCFTPRMVTVDEIKPDALSRAHGGTAGDSARARPAWTSKPLGALKVLRRIGSEGRIASDRPAGNKHDRSAGNVTTPDELTTAPFYPLPRRGRATSDIPRFSRKPSLVNLPESPEPPRKIHDSGSASRRASLASNSVSGCDAVPISSSAHAMLR
ncbi:hypothetical protein CF326_g3547 [Tilletia indica]|nr:hypothetical protein CF326_g3547 [Tilletia indica]